MGCGRQAARLLDVSKMSALGWRARTDLRGLEVTYRDFLAGGGRGMSRTPVTQDHAGAGESSTMGKPKIIGHLVSAGGSVLWIYGYFASGTPSLVDWHAAVPEWIAKFLPNLESEIGMGLTFVAMIPLYWPSKR